MIKYHFQYFLCSATNHIEESETILYKHKGIVITNKKIITYNRYSRDLTTRIFIKDIVEIIPYNLFGILPFGLKIIYSNKSVTFISFDRAKLIEILKALVT